MLEIKHNENQELIEIPIREVFNEDQRTSIHRYFKKYKLNFKKKLLKIKRCDSLQVLKSRNCITLKDINILLKKAELEYEKTKNMSTKESTKTIQKMKKDIENFLLEHK